MRERWQQFQDTVITAGGVVAIAGAIIGGASWVFDLMPVVKASTYQADKERVDSRLTDAEVKVRALSDGMTNIQRTGFLNLQLQLRTRTDLINATLRTAAQGTPQYFGLQAELNATQQQLDEVTRQLNR